MPHFFDRPLRGAHSGFNLVAVVGGNEDPMLILCETGRPFGPSNAQDEDMMKNLFAAYRAEAAKRKLYRQTRDEIAALPRSIAMDLGIYPEDAERMAHKAVWG